MLVMLLAVKCGNGVRSAPPLPKSANSPPVGTSRNRFLPSVECLSTPFSPTALPLLSSSFSSPEDCLLRSLLCSRPASAHVRLDIQLAGILSYDCPCPLKIGRASC